MELYNDLKRYIGKILGTRCTGACCKRFFLPASPEEVQQSYKRAIGELNDGGLIYLDIEIIAPMVELVERTTEGKHFYKCKHITNKGDCGIYLKRPRMCSDYPYKGICTYSGCTWSKASKKGLLYKIGIGCKKIDRLHKESLEKNGGAKIV